LQQLGDSEPNYVDINSDLNDLGIDRFMRTIIPFQIDFITVRDTENVRHFFSRRVIDLKAEIATRGLGDKVSLFSDKNDPNNTTPLKAPDIETEIGLLEPIF